MSETMIGPALITDAKAAKMTAEMYYFNIHTAQFPDGEHLGPLAVRQ